MLGLDLIITDHHHAPDDLPAARAILNPNQAGDAYPNKGLSGVGVAYKLARALEQVFPAIHAQDLLDLVAIGTVADMSPLIGENRYLVRAGLERINAAPRTGVRALIQAAGYAEGRVDSRSIGFGLGPRINAAGRLEDARHAYELLICSDQGRAANLAEQLDALNRRRQDLTFEVVDAAVAQLADPDGMVLSAFGEQFHEGVVGLAASRLADEYFRPALVGKTGERTTRASARSVPGFHLARALEACGEFLLRFGGHEMAAGLTVENRNLEGFLKRFDEVARDRLDDDLLTPRLDIRAEVGLGEIGSRLLKFHDRLEPTGQENPRPLLATRAARIVHRRRVGGEGRHLKLKVSDGGRAIDAIAFRKGDLMDELPEVVDLAYRLERNE